MAGNPLGPLNDLLGNVPGLSMVFGEGGMLGPAIQAPVQLQQPVRDVDPSLIRQVGAPQVGGLNQAQQAVLGLYSPQQAPPFAGIQPGGLYAPVQAPRAIAGGQVGGPIPSPGMAQSGQAPQLFGAAPFGVNQIGGVYGLGGPLGPQLPQPQQPAAPRQMPRPAVIERPKRDRPPLTGRSVDQRTMPAQGPHTRFQSPAIPRPMGGGDSYKDFWRAPTTPRTVTPRATPATTKARPVPKPSKPRGRTTTTKARRV